MRRPALRPVLSIAALALVGIVGCGSDDDERAAVLADSGSYEVRTWNECPTDSIDSGSWDQASNTYVPCGTRINVYDASGARVRQIDVGRDVSDVAASPDRGYLYLALGANMPRRMVRQPDGSYVLDQQWKLSSYSHPDYGNGISPRGHFIATDGSGNIYLADGAWTEGPGDDGKNRGGGYITVVKYSPAGQVVTRFGSQRNTWDRGYFYNANAGIAVSPDGGRVYTTELNNSRVQRWERQANGSYVSTWTLGSTQANDPNRQGGAPPDTETAKGQYTGRLAAPYDVQLDQDGNLFVLNTTAHQVLKFTQAGELLYAKTIGSDGQGPRPHAFAVSKNGGFVYVTQSRKRLVPPGSNEDGGDELDSDADGDGIPFGDDSCPGEPGPASNFGCPKSDGGGSASGACASARKALAAAQRRLRKAKANLNKAASPKPAKLKASVAGAKRKAARAQEAAGKACG